MGTDFARDRMFKIIEIVHRYVEKAQTYFDDANKWRQGGYFCLRRHGTPEPLILTAIGIIPEQKRYRYWSFSQEKADRLYLLISMGDRTSFQSRSEAREQYGGAISTTSEFIFSFSGFEERWDEAVVLAAAIELSWITRDDAFLIAHETTREPLYLLLSA